MKRTESPLGIVTTAWLVAWTLGLAMEMVSVAPAQDSVLDDDALERLLVTELATVLDETTGVAPLPRNVSNVVIGPGGEPCFVVPMVDPYRPMKLAQSIDRLGRHEPGFRLVWEASVIGRDGDRSMLLSAGDRGPLGQPTDTATVVVVERDGTNTMTLPGTKSVRHASRSGDRWVFLTDRGLIASGETTPWPGSEVFGRGMAPRMFSFGTDGFAAFTVTHEQDGTQRGLIGIADNGAWSIETIPSMPRDPVRTVVRRDDGRWLAIGRKIIEIDPDRPAKPPEADLQAAVDAARAGDWPVFLEKLERVSSYPPEDLAGLMTLIAAIPDRGARLRALQGQLDQMRRSLAAMPVPDGLDAAQTERVTGVLSTTSKQLQDAMDAVAAAAPELLVQSPSATLQYLRSGMQRYRGQWVQVNHVLQQDAIDSATLLITTVDQKSGATKRAIGKLEADGSLTPFGDLPYQWAMPDIGWHTDATGNSYGIVQGKGLARISSRGLEWIGTADRLKGPMQVLGIDACGRVYLRDTRQRSGATGPQGESPLWVFVAKPEAVETANVNIWPIVGQPAADADGSIWFLERTFRQPNGMASPPVAPITDTSGITKTTVSLVDESPAPTPQPFIGQPDGGLLARLDSPTTVTEYANLRIPAQSMLMAGRSAAWLEGQRGIGSGQFMFLDGKTVRRSSDMHALAAQHFEAILEAAPTASVPGAWCGAQVHQADSRVTQILRTGNLLWVNALGKVEVYDKGKPLAVHDRLILHAGTVEQPRLIGPLDRGDGRKSVLVMTAPQRIERFAWITPTDTGLIIDWSETPPREWLGGVLTSSNSFSGLPLVADDTSWLAACNGFGRVWQILGLSRYTAVPDAGYPILAVPKSDAFLAWRADRVRSGIRICSPKSRRDVPVTFTTRLDPVAFCGDGRLLCLCPDGLAWLEPDDEKGYVLAETRCLPHGLTPLTFVGSIGDSVVITAGTSNWETCLVAVRVPKPAP